MSIVHLQLSGDSSKRVNRIIVNAVWIGFGVLEWVLVAYIIDLIVRSILQEVKMAGWFKRLFVDEDDTPVRDILDGDTYEIEDLEAGRVRLVEDAPDPNPPPENVRGEPWGWTKGPPYPRGYREDGRYDRGAD